MKNNTKTDQNLTIGRNFVEVLFLSECTMFILVIFDTCLRCHHAQFQDRILN